MKYIAIAIFLTLFSLNVSAQEKITNNKNNPSEFDHHPSANDFDEYQSSAESTAPTIAVPGLYSPNIPGVSKWVFPALDAALGAGLFDVADVTGDGELEIITTGAGRSFSNPRSIFVLDFSLMKAVCMLPELNQFVFDHRILQVDEGQSREVLLVTDHGTLVFDGKTCEVKEQYLFAEFVESAAFGDFEGNGGLSVAFSINGDLRIAKWNDLENYTERRGFGGNIIRTGPLAHPGKDDLAVQAEVLFLLNGESLSTINELVPPGAAFLELADITGDGLSEVLVGAAWHDGVTAFNSDGTEQLFNRPVFNLGYLGSQDINGDGKATILFANRQSGGGYALDEFGNELWAVATLNSGASGMAVVNGESSSNSKLVWSVGGTTTAKDTIDIHALSNGNLLGRSGRFADAFKTASIDQSRVAILSTWSGTMSNGIHIVDRQTGSLIHTIDLPGSINQGNASDDIAVGVLDGATNQNAICVSTRFIPYWFLLCYDADDYSSIAELQFDTGAYSYIKLTDVNMNGQSELLGVNTEGFLTAYSLLDGSVLWRSQDLGLDISNIWGVELIHSFEGMLWVLDPAGNLRVLNGDDGSLVRSEESTPLRYFDVLDGVIYAVRENEGVGKIDPSSLEFSSVIYPSTETLVALDVAEDGKFLITGVGNESGMEVVFVSLHSLFEPWLMSELDVRNIESIGLEDVLISTSSGVINLRLTTLYQVFHDGFLRH